MSGIFKFFPLRRHLCRTINLPKFSRRELANKPEEVSSRSNAYGNILKYTLIAAVSTGFGIGLYKFSYDRFYAYPPLNINYNGEKTESFRQHFNFIDKVVKRCASSVVYIEIKDPSRLDPETGKPGTASNGSGFFISDDGWILTNAHVVINKPQSMIMVMLQDGSSYQATVQDADMNIDLALLKIQSNHKLPFLRLGKSADVSTGEWVIALGSPLSLSHSVTAGVISSVNRGAQELGLQNFSMRYIQTDAAITFGNSGGPLVNLDGDVIGINNLRVTAGIAFAIPVDYAKKFLERSRFTTKAEPVSLERDKKSFLGITTISVTPKIIGELRQIHQSIPDEVMQGVLVWKVVTGTLAHESGLEAGDIITHIDGTPVHDASDIYILCSKEKRKVKMDIIHHGKKKRITVKPPR